MKRLYALAIGITLFLGVAHTILTPLFYPAFTIDALWFAGTGLALVFNGLLNLAAYRARLKWMLDYVIPANGVLAVYLTAVAAALPEIQAFLAALAVWIMVLTSIFARLQTNSNPVEPVRG
ncbi:MAG: hypothetical protein R6X34_17985 [Chloroflexota bacterium]